MFKIKSKFIKLKPIIISIFFLVTSIVVSFLIFIQYNTNKDFALKLTTNSFYELSNKINKQIKNQDEESYNFLNILEEYDSINEIPLKDTRHSAIKIFTKFLENKEYIYSLYFAKSDDTFYEVINLNHDINIKKSFNAPQNARWLIVKIYDVDNKKIKFEEYLDSNLLQLESNQKESLFKASTRLWFQEAINSNDIIKTQPYIFTFLNKYGLSYAKKVNNKDLVIGLDITIKSLENVLANNKLVQNSKIFFYKKNAEIILNENVLANNELSENVKEFDKNIINFTDEDKIVSLDSKKYIHGKFTFRNGEVLQIFSPLDEILEPYIHQVYFFILISILLFIFIGIPLIVIASNLITNPLNKIMKENEKIKNRKFSDVKKINFSIVELDELSESLLDMSKAINQYQLNQSNLMDSFIRLIATAIDEKSEYTGAHCKRVPDLSLMIIEEANKSEDGIFKDFKIENEDQLRELSISAWLHDCGKVTTPEYVVDKATKLETIYNRIHEIRTRFEVIYRDLIIQSLYAKLEGKDSDEVDKYLKIEQSKLIDDFEFIAKTNIGSEFLEDEDKNRIKEISNRTWLRYFDNKLGLSNDEKSRMNLENETLPIQENLLSDKLEHIIKRAENFIQKNEKYNFKMEIPTNLYNLGEIYNLSISSGTLTNEERYKIQEHIIMTIKMLEELPFPEELKNIPMYAGAHHETLIGTGYPRKLKKEDMPIASRIIAIADVFEALTASDRPYKQSKTVSESIKILSSMVKKEHLDKDIFELFLKTGVYKKYAEKHLNSNQIDDININDFI